MYNSSNHYYRKRVLVLISSDIDKFYNHIGKNIKTIRNSKNLRQEDLANMVGLSRTSIVNIEKGRQKLLLHTLVDIANALSTDIMSILSPAKGEPFAKILSKLPENKKKAVEVVLKKRGDKKP